MSFALELSGICKSYGASRVLNNISCSIETGVVVSIVGENGAGKSTLAKLIAGVTQPDSGTLTLFGSPVSFAHPAEATRAGVAMVHQEIALLDNLTVAENICLGHEPLGQGLLAKRLLDRSAMQDIAHEALMKIGLSIKTTTLVSALSLAQKQMVEIARALSWKARVLILDEPTSSISDTDARTLLDTVSTLRSLGVTIFYVSHRIPEVLEISDWILALRDGEVSGTLRRPHISREAIIQSMVGRDLKDMYSYKPRPLGEPVLELSQFRASPQHAPLTLRVRAGEIIGIAGLIGSGRSELLEALYGVRPPSSGTISCGDTENGYGTVALLPESRKEQALFESFSIAETISLSSTRGTPTLSTRSATQEYRTAEHWIRDLSIHCRGPHQTALTLSGGNQQKVVLGRCLASSPRVLLLDEPTRGVDIGARHSIYKILLQLAEQGLAIIFVSSELEEVLGLSDRILVMNSGNIAGIIERKHATEHAIMTLATHQEDAPRAA